MATRTGTIPIPSERRGADDEPPDAFALRRGASLGRYQLLAPVAAGGMAYVWAAARTGDYGFHRLFAIKVMREEIAFDASFRRMFLEEAKLAARIRHTNVVEVLDLGEQAGTVYQVMPLIEGDSLAGLLRSLRARDASARVPRAVAVRIVVDALRGLHAAHETLGPNGMPLAIVHRDVSPHNVLVGVDGIAKLADFGVAKATASVLDETETGDVRGKLAYMSPEQLQKRKIDRRSDVFSAGIVLWELLAGERMAPTAASLAIANEAIPEPRARDASVPSMLADVAIRALAPEPHARFATADAMADALESAARAAGLTLSAKEVGSWTASLTTGALARRQGEVTEAASTIGITLGEGPRAGRTRRRAAAIVAAVIAVAVGLVAVRARVRTVDAPPPPMAIPAPVPFEVIPPAPHDEGPIAPAVTPSKAVEAVGSARAAPASRSPKARAPEPKRPKFDNPYAR
jgi:serine/threonine-protein kinase